MKNDIVISKEVKQRHEAILEFEKGNRQNLIGKVNAKIRFLLNYLPQQLSEEEICEIVRQAVIKVGTNSMKNMSKVMAAVRPSLVLKVELMVSL